MFLLLIFEFHEQLQIFIKIKFVFQEIHKDPKHLQLWRIYRRFTHDCYVSTAIQNRSAKVLLQFYTELQSAFLHLSLACFCITIFSTYFSPCIKLYILCSSWYFLPLPLNHSRHFSQPSISCIAVQLPHSDQDFSSFSSTHFLANHFCQQPFLIFNFYNVGCQLNVIGKCMEHMPPCKFNFIFCFYLLYLPPIIQF